MPGEGPREAQRFRRIRPRQEIMQLSQRTKAVRGDTPGEAGEGHADLSMASSTAACGSSKLNV